MLKQLTTCVHVDQDGVTWVNTPEGVPTPIIGKYRPSKTQAMTYRVIGIPKNYKIIVYLYLALINKEIKGNLLVGSPLICRRHQNSSLQLLNCISVLNSHDNLPHTWHQVDSTSYRNFLLLEVKQEKIQGSSLKIEDRLQHWYLKHTTYPFWQFLKIEKHTDLIFEILAAIVDPRWFLNIKHPNKLTRLNAHFGLMPFANFSKLWNLRTKKKLGKLNTKQQRANLLIEIVKVLPENSPILLDTSCDITNKKDVYQICKRLLSFIARNWLARIVQHFEFDPKIFFNNKLIKDSFLKQFGE